MRGDVVGIRCRPDETATFEQVFLHHKDYVYRLALAMLGDPAEAEDAVQEVFMQVYRALDRYDPERASLNTWLYRIAVNHCSSRLRRRRVRNTFLQKARSQTPRPQGPLPRGLEQRLLYSEQRQAIWQAINGLGQKHRTVLILHYYLDMTAPDIAQILNIRIGTVYSRLHTARCRLRDDLEQQGIALEG